MKNNEIKQLERAYTKKFKKLGENFFTNKETGLIFFAEYLRYFRDFLVISLNTDLNKQEALKLEIATLATAIAEYDEYKVCQDEAKRVFHWDNYCELVKINMEGWLDLVDSI
jgi:hypothetical protein